MDSSLRKERTARFYLASKDSKPFDDAGKLFPYLKKLKQLNGGAIYISPYDGTGKRDLRIPFFNVMNVMDVCKKAGFHDLRFTVAQY